MTAVARTRLLSALVCLSLVAPLCAADPLADLLPLPARQIEKRVLMGGDNDVRYYRGERGRPGAAFSPDGKLLAVSSPYTGMVVWDLAAGRNLGTLGGIDRSEGMTLAFTPDGKQLVTVNWANGRHGGSCPVALWDVKKRERLRSLDEDANDTLFLSATVSPDGKTLALGGGFSRRGGANPGLHLWDVASGDELRKIDGLIAPDANRRFGGMMQALAFSPDGRTLALLADGKALLLEVATGKLRTQMTVAAPPDPRLEQQGEFPVGALAFSADGRTLAVGSHDGTVRRLDLRTGREMPPLTGHTGGVAAICFTPDGKTLMTFGADTKLFVWSADASRDWQPKSVAADEKALERLWDTLRTDDPLDLYGCTQLLRASPDAAVALLRKRLTAVPSGDSARIEKLVADLQKPEYNERKKALRELREIGVLAVPALRQAAERNGDELVRRLMFEFESQSPPREQIRAVRALEVLERIGSDDARALLAELAKGAPEASFTTEAKAALERATKGKGGLGADPKPEALWEALGGDDSASAFQAARLVVRRADAVVPFFADRLRELAAGDAFDDDPKRVAKLLTDLDSEDFETRDKALKGLKTLGKLCEGDLRKALTTMPSPEVKRQIDEVLADVGKQVPSAEVLRVGRALEALEWVGTPAARKAVEGLATTARGQWLRAAAAAALKRME